MIFYAAVLTFLHFNVAIAAVIELKLGGAMALTGRFRSSANACIRGWTLWAETLNAQGGLTLSNGDVVTVHLSDTNWDGDPATPPPFAIRDDTSSGALSAAILEGMLNSSSPTFTPLDFVIGPFSSGITAVSAPVAERHQKILMSHGASETLYNRGNEYIFSVMTPGPLYMDSGLSLLYQAGARSVVITHQDSAFPLSVCKGANQTAHALGMNVLRYNVYDTGATNFAEVVLDSIQLQPDVYVGCGHINDITYLIQNLNVLDMNFKALLLTYATDARILNNVGKQNAHAVMGPTQWDKGLDFSDTEGFFGSAQQWNDAYEARWGIAPIYQAAYCSANGYALGKAIVAADSIATEDVKAAFRNLSIQSFYGPLEFSAPGDPSGLVGTQARRPMVTLQVNTSLAPPPSTDTEVFRVVAPPAAASAPLIYPSPTWIQKAKIFYPCPLGSRMVSGACTLCGTGEYRNADLLECVACERGEYSNTSGSSACVQCDVGRYAQSAGQSACQVCAAGSIAEEKGKSRCLECSPGTFARQEEAGSSRCESCSIGKYSEILGSTACLECTSARGSSSTTLSHGADSIVACVCRPGTYMASDFSTCLPCPQGMDCPGGLGPPLLSPGFWAEESGVASRIYSVYRCRNERECVSGPVGANCALNRIGMACAKCDAGTTPNQDNGTCDECTGTQILPIVFGILLAVVLVVWLTFLSGVDFGGVKTNKTNLSVALCLGQVPLVAQILSVFGEIKVNWYEPMKSFLGVVSILSFKIEMLNFSCMIPESNPVAIFITKLMALPCCCALLYLIFVVKARLRGVSVDQTMLCNSVGTIYYICFTALTLISVSPFQCLDSPNGSSSVSSNPSVLCEASDSNFLGLAILGVAGVLFYTVLFFAFVLWLVWQYPRMIASAQVCKSLRKYRFVFLRFSVERYFYSAAFLLRGMLIAFTTIIFANHGTRQVLLIACVLVGFGGLQAWLLPWRTLMANLVDALVSGLLVLTIVSGGMILGATPSEREMIQSDTQNFMTVVMVLLISLFPALLSFRAYRYFRPHKHFDAFLSHHKAGCGVGARHLKMLLTQRNVGNIFLDSDELDDLEDLLDYVRSHVKSFVLLLTAETLWRPWCAGEIAMSFLMNVPTVSVAYDDYVEPTDAELTNSSLSDRFPKEQWSAISTQGVSLEDVSGAYLKIRGMAKIGMKRIGCSMSTVDEVRVVSSEVATCIFQGSTGSSTTAEKTASEKFRHQESRAALIDSSVIVLGDNGNAEAVSTVQVLATLLSRWMQTDALELFTAEDVEKTSLKPKCIVVSLTMGAVTSDSFANLWTAVYMSFQKTPIVSVRSQSYVCPTKDALFNGIYEQVAKFSGWDLQLIREAYDALLSVLAMPFLPSGAQNLMELESRYVANRVTHVMSLKPAQTPTATNIRASFSKHPVSRVDLDSGHVDLIRC